MYSSLIDAVLEDPRDWMRDEQLIEIVNRIFDAEDYEGSAEDLQRIQEIMDDES